MHKEQIRLATSNLFKENRLKNTALCFVGLLIMGMISAAEHPAAGESTLTATALQVNDGAVTFIDLRRLIPPESEGNLVRWAGEMDVRQFSLQVKSLLGRAAMDAVRNTLIYQFARRDLEQNENFEEVLTKVRAEQKQSLLFRYDGNEARAREDYLRRGFSLDDVLNEMERGFIVSSYWEKRFPREVRITRLDMLQYYREHMTTDYTHKESIRFQLIDIQEDRFAAPEQAAGAARAAWEKLRAGEDFAAVVREYSHDFRKTSDGIWPAVDPQSLQAKYQPVVKALASLKAGEYTDVISGEGRYFIAKLLDRQGGGVTPFSEVQFEIRDILYRLLQQKHNAAITEQMLEDAAIGNMDRFVEESAIALYHHVKQFPAVGDTVAGK